MKNLSMTNDDLVTIHRSLSTLQTQILPFNDHSVNQLLKKVEHMIRKDQEMILTDLEHSMKQFEFRVKYCKVNDLLHDLDSWEYQLNHAQNQVEYLNAWLKEIKTTAP